MLRSSVRFVSCVADSEIGAWLWVLSWYSWDGKSLPGKQYTKKRRMDDINEAKHQFESYFEQTHDVYSGNIIYLHSV